MNGINIIILLMILSGLIAYLGDRIGMKAGKKRISIFGLRPRYSSIIITIITGIIIAALSISILLVTYSSLRQAILNINTVITKLENLNQTLNEKDDELETMKTEINDKSMVIEQKSREIEEYSEELSTLENKKNELESELELTKAEFEQDIKALRTSKQELEKRKQELETNKQELEELITELKNQEKELLAKITNLENKVSEVEQKYQQAQQGLQDVYEYYKGADFVYQRGEVIYSDVIVAGTSENKIIQDLTSFLEEADKVARQREINVSEDGRALRVRQEDILNTAKILYNLEEGQRVIVTLVSRVNVSQDEWLTANFVYNIDKIVFNQEQLIASRKINAELPPMQIESELRSLLEIVNQKAIENGLLIDIQREVVDINYSQFYELQENIRKQEGIVELKVYAVKDIWREDNLNSNNLRFVISNADSKTGEVNESEND